MSTGILAAALVPIGFAFSYMRRGNRNVGLKIILTIGLFAAFAAFLNGVQGATNIDETRAPLIGVFLWVQVMHGFDLPRARDLSFSIAASVVLIALAGSLAFSSGFLVFVVIYAALLITALVLAYRAELYRTQDGETVISVPIPVAPTAARRSLGSIVSRAAALGVVTVVFTGVVFVFLPRLPATQLASLPFSFGKANPIDGFVGDVALPSGASEAGSSEAFDPDTYFGYGEALNLRVRGRLSDDLVMRVRSPKPSLYRAQAYDTYSEGRWTSSDSELEEVQGGGLGSISIPAPEEGRTIGEELVQTFYVERELPNIVFHAYLPQEIFVSESRVRVDDFTSIRLPFTMDVDTIYSVISNVPERDVSKLRFAPAPDPSNPAMQRYLQLPPSLDDRFRDLALSITQPHPTAADKAEAVQAWLKENKRYRLDIPRDPPNKDPVNVFVFERDEGFCEQIAATMALMLRASGVPTRVVTGFGEGERNLFTGYWEIRNSDAHAWVEVFYPGAGWIPYDPTFGVPVASAANTTFMLAPIAKIAQVVPSVLGGVGRAASALVRALPGPSWLLIVPLVVLAFWGVRRIRARTERRILPLDAAGRAAKSWLELEAALGARGWRRPPHETALEFADRLSPLRGQLGADLRDLAVRFGAFRYGGMDGEELEAWQRDVDEAIVSIRTSAKKPRGDRTRVGVR
jgi:transglutaminase-like putative cysteine protease